MGYEQLFSYGGDTFNIEVTMRTSVLDLGGGKTANLNTVVTTNYDGTTTTKTDLTDEEIQTYINGRKSLNEQMIDGVPNPELDAALVDDGYTRIP